jgi:hypothetical protein
MRYVYLICFVGNRGFPFGPYLAPYKSRKEAKAKASSVDGCGRRYGAFVRRVKIPEAEFRQAK